jgi:hypothetical protein
LERPRDCGESIGRERFAKLDGPRM